MSLLIGSVLFLRGGVTGTGAVSPTPSPRATESNTKKPEERNTYADHEQAIRPYRQSAAKATPTPQLQETADQYRNKAKQEYFQWPDVSIWTAILLAIFTGLLVVVGFLQVWLMKLVFDNDRPVIVVSKLVANESPLQAFRPTITLRNAGTKPAILVKAVGHIHSHQRQPYRVPSKPRYQELPACTLDRSALGTGDETDITCGTYILNAEESLEYAAAEKDFAIYGLISYERTAGLRKRTYETYFFWFYSPPTAQLMPEGGFYLGPAEYNRHT